MAPARNGSIDAVIFDLGGVLLDWNPRYLYRKLFDDEEAMERFLGEVCTMEWHEANDRGVPFEVTCARLAAEHPEHAEHIWAWGTRTEEMVGGPIDGTVEILRELGREGSVRLFALTNMEAHTYPLRRERYDFLRWFEGTVVSSAEGVIKPDAEIFQRAARALRPRAGLDADDRRRPAQRRGRPGAGHADRAVQVARGAARGRSRTPACWRRAGLQRPDEPGALDGHQTRGAAIGAAGGSAVVAMALVWAPQLWHSQRTRRATTSSDSGSMTGAGSCEVRGSL